MKIVEEGESTECTPGYFWFCIILEEKLQAGGAIVSKAGINILAQLFLQTCF